MEIAGATVLCTNSARMASRSLVNRSAPGGEPALLTRIVTSGAAVTAAVIETGSVTSIAIGIAPGRSTEEGLRAPA